MSNELKISALKEKWEEYKTVDISEAKNAYDKFHEWIKDLPEWDSDKPLNHITLDQYTSLKKSSDAVYFTNWLERRTEKCGKFRTASSYAYGVYRINSDVEGYKTVEQREKKGASNALDKKNAEDYFKNNVRPVLNTLATLTDGCIKVAPLEINYARKIAYMFNPDKLLPIFKKETIESIANFFGIEDDFDSSSLMATSEILEKVRGDWKLGDTDFELTQKLGMFLFDYFGKSFSLAHKNTIFYGAPGTGKTYIVQEGLKQRLLLAGADKKNVYFTQFHPSYSYEDFIDGLKPVSGGNGSITLKLQSGNFKKLCKLATDNLREAKKEKKTPQEFYFVADEINRAELSRVFGEVLVCLEESKRIDFDDQGGITGLFLKSQYGHLDSESDAVLTMNGEHYFGVPSNLYFIGTMNDVDRSIDSFDLALRRRFVWIRKDCEYEVIQDKFFTDKAVESYIKICKGINRLIAEEWGMGRSYEIGHAYFLEMKTINKGNVAKLFEHKISPLLAEYLRAEYSVAEIESKLKAAKERFVLP